MKRCSIISTERASPVNRKSKVFWMFCSRRLAALSSFCLSLSSNAAAIGRARVFSLTPTLSRWERRKRSQRLGKAKAFQVKRWPETFNMEPSTPNVEALRDWALKVECSVFSEGRRKNEATINRRPQFLLKRSNCQNESSSGRRERNVKRGVSFPSLLPELFPWCAFTRNSRCGLLAGAASQLGRLRSAGL
jgi:hypothetical protein